MSKVFNAKLESYQLEYSHAYIILIAELHRSKVQSMLNGTQSKIEYVYHIGKEFMGYAALLSAQ